MKRLIASELPRVAFLVSKELSDATLGTTADMIRCQKSMPAEEAGRKHNPSCHK